MFVFIANILKPHGNNLGRSDIFLYYIKQMKINFKPNCLQLCKGIQSILYSIVNKQIKLHAQLLSIQGRTVGTKNKEATTYLPTIVFGGVNDSSIYINLTTHSSKTCVHIINYTQTHVCIHTLFQGIWFYAIQLCCHQGMYIGCYKKTETGYRNT